MTHKHNWMDDTSQMRGATRIGATAPGGVRRLAPPEPEHAAAAPAASSVTPIAATPACASPSPLPASLSLSFSLPSPSPSPSPCLARPIVASPVHTDNRRIRVTTLRDVACMAHTIEQPINHNQLHQTQQQQHQLELESALKSSDTSACKRKLSSSSSSSSFESPTPPLKKARTGRELPLDRRLCNIRGRIDAISPVIQQEQATFFFVEISEHTEAVDTPNGTSVCVASSSPSSGVRLASVAVFTGASSLRWYSTFRIGREYILTRMRASELFKDQREHRTRVFVNTNTKTEEKQETDSSKANEHKHTIVIPVEPAMEPYYLDAASEAAAAPAAPVGMDDSLLRNPPAPQSPFASSPHCSPPGSPLVCLSYTGLITAIPSFGVYQLDGDDHCMAHLHPLQVTDPHSHRDLISMMRVGARVKLHNVHLMHQGGRCMGFICCLRSHIEVVKPTTAAASATPNILPTIPRWYAHLWSNYSMRDVVLLLHAFRVWQRKMGQLVGPTQLLPLLTGMLDGALESPPDSTGIGAASAAVDSATRKRRTMEMYTEFLDHDSCTFNRTHALAERTINRLIHVEDIHRIAAVRQLRTKLTNSVEWSYGTISSSHLFRSPSSSASSRMRVSLVGVLQSTLRPDRLFTVARSFSSRAANGDADAAATSPISRTSWQLRDKTGTIDCTIIIQREQVSHAMTLHNAIVRIDAFVLVMEVSPKRVSDHHRLPSISGSSPSHTASTALTADLNSTITILLVDAKDIVVMQPPIATQTIPHATTSMSSSHQLTGASLLITHKYDVILKPSVSHLPKPACGAAPRLHHQSTLSSSAFNHEVRAVIEVQRRTIDHSANGTTTSLPTLTHARLDLGPDHLSLYPSMMVGGAIETTHLIEDRDALSGATILRTTPNSTIVSLDRLHSVATLPEPPLLDVRDVLVCPLPSSLVPKSGVDVDFVSFRGVILEKQFRIELQTNNNNNNNSSGSMLRRWWLNVRDIETAHTIHLHVDPALHCFTLLIPGMLIHCHRVSRRIQSNYRLQLEDVAETHIEVVRSIHLPRTAPSSPSSSSLLFESDSAPCAGDTDALLVRRTLPTHFPITPLPITYLAHLPTIPTCINERIYRMRVRIGILSKLVMRWSCGSCGQPIAPARRKCASHDRRIVAPPSCQSAVPHLHIECSVLVDDGSGVATVYLDGPLVWDLLHLPLQRRAQLESFTLDVGCYEFFRIDQRILTEDAINLAEDAALQLTRARRQMWDKRLREEYAGMECNLYARQIYLRGNMQAAIARAADKKRQQHAARVKNGGASTALPLAHTFSVPFAACTTRPIPAGPHNHLTTLQPPPIILKAIEIQPMQQQQTRNAAQAILQDLKRTARS